MAKKLRFYKKSHKYKYGNKVLEGVTSFVGKFFEAFDEKAVARKLSKIPDNKAKKQGVRYFLNKWKASREYGSFVHTEIEYAFDALSKKEFPSLLTTREAQFGLSWLANKNFPIGTMLETEKRVFNEDLELAGTIDLCITKDNKVTLVDWKTNEKFSKEAYKNKRGILPPTADIPDCHLTKYSLQLSVYAYIMEGMGYEVEKLYIVHLSKEGYEEIEVAYLRDKVREMLKYNGRLIGDSSNNMGGS